MPGETSISGKRVLVIDDDVGLTTLVKLILGRIGIETEGASSGPAGLDLLEKQDFDVLILDDMMPGMDGYEVLRRIRTDPRWEKMPAILFTARQEPEMLAAEHGFDGVVVKPCLQTDIQREVQRFLTRGRTSEKH